MLKWLGGGARKRPPRRVAVIDAAAVDRRRRVVLIRRDNIEHLMMIGGPTDVLIEPNIIRANGARGPAWPAAPRPTRLAGELSNRLTPPEVPPPPARNKAARVAPPLMKPQGVSARTLAPPEEPPPSPQTAHNLDELERQLEAALRHSPALQGRPPVTNPLAVPPSATKSARPVAQPDAPIHGLERPSEPRLDAKPEPKSEPKIEPKFEPPKPKTNASWSRNRSRGGSTARAGAAGHGRTRRTGRQEGLRHFMKIANLLGCPPGEYFRRRLLSAFKSLVAVLRRDVLLEPFFELLISLPHTSCAHALNKTKTLCCCIQVEDWPHSSCGEARISLLAAESQFLFARFWSAPIRV